MQTQTISKRKIVIITLIGLLSVAVIYFGIVAMSRSGKTPISLSIFPSDASVTIDGKTVKTGILRLPPGTYELEAKKQGYDPYTKTVVLADKRQTIAVILNPNSKEALEYGRKNETEYRKVQAQGEVAAAEAGKVFSDLNPITKHLPDKTYFFSIGYRMDQSDPSGNSIIIEIDASEAYREASLNRIRQLGYDPTDFTINFRNYENPFPL